MTTQHTPGPWNFDEHNGKLWITDDTGIGTIALLIPEPDKGIWDEDKANARLIAAAPELLEALKIAMHYMEGDSDDEQEEADYSTIKEAIAKATAADH